MNHHKWMSGIIAVVAGFVLLICSSGEALASDLEGVYVNGQDFSTLIIEHANDSTGVFSGKLSYKFNGEELTLKVTGIYSFTQGGHVGDPTIIDFTANYEEQELAMGQAWAGVTKAYEYDVLDMKGTMGLIKNGVTTVTRLNGPFTRT